MATVKRKHTRRRGRNRRAGHAKLPVVKATTCPKCGEVTLPHHLCPSCGNYRGRTIIETEAAV